jgi:hypothetical protein
MYYVIYPLEVIAERNHRKSPFLYINRLMRCAITLLD